jgi:hypothetical protein
MERRPRSRSLRSALEVWRKSLGIEWRFYLTRTSAHTRQVLPDMCISAEV